MHDRYVATIAKVKKRGKDKLSVEKSPQIPIQMERGELQFNWKLSIPCNSVFFSL
ncbi:hypothetical protein PORCRE_2107 [Porphyromonas crevioricanis JCM 15906]|uniref:Uncharacterized protein n=1 Tax=Porphyromonas crevioricanis JCM 15906 TaxID=1305617 RepID=T1DU99_9PORP|nr:hypothetical protein PORCRE_2107 [Porphyromonas crevioricanis JCM 15906]GAD08258.1 hypothetical protein PORCAN_1896 [Porphyromonas crevioricanis JCM 13913]